MPKTPRVDESVEAPAAETESGSPVLPSFMDLYNKANAPFDKTHERQIQGGKSLTYITGEQALQRLTETYGPNWDWAVDPPQVLNDDVIVTGTLTVRTITSDNPQGLDIARAGVGGARIKRGRQSGETLDVGNDAKSAETSAFKRACVKFGVGAYLYEKTDSDDELPRQQTYGQQGSYTPQAQRQVVQFPADGLNQGSTTGAIEAVSMPRMGDDGRQKLGGLKVNGQWYNVSNRAPVELGQYQRGQVVTIQHEPGKSFIDGVSLGVGAGESKGSEQAEEMLAF
jgi:hypothetical protein